MVHMNKKKELLAFDEMIWACLLHCLLSTMTYFIEGDFADGFDALMTAVLLMTMMLMTMMFMTTMVITLMLLAMMLMTTMVVPMMLMTTMLKAEDSIQIPADTISGLYFWLYWEMTTIMMKLKKNMMDRQRLCFSFMKTSPQTKCHKQSLIFTSLAFIARQLLCQYKLFPLIPFIMFIRVNLVIMVIMVISILNCQSHFSKVFVKYPHSPGSDQ